MYSGPMSGTSLPIDKEPGKNSPRSTASSSDPHQELTTIEIDLVDDRITILNVNTEPMPPERLRFEQNSSFAKRLTSVSQELRRFASVPEPRSLPRRSARTGEANSSSAIHALKGLKFTSTTDKRESREAIERRFDAITETTDGLLHRSQFGKCIGMDSEGFALELFDALARRRLMNGEAINKEQLVEFWEQISDSNFDSRLHTFFDIVDKDGDGRISEEEVKEIIILSASANKLSNIQKRADEYAALIMEELDHDNCAYIMIESLKTLLLQASTETRRTPEDTPMLNYKIKPTQRSYSTWMRVASPGILYTGQRLMRAFRFAKTVTITKVALYPEEVLTLQMVKPPGFRYKSGQYMFIKCAEVSPFQWHPFFFTSAPQDDYLSVHIKALGDWTEALRERFANACQPPSVAVDGLRDRNMLSSANNPKLPKIQIDGPYGATPEEYKEYKVVLLVGMGIGVTPMISILRDIVNNIKARKEEAETETTENGSSERLNFVMEKAYFYWLTEEQGTFDWFKNTIKEVAELEHNHVIELHNYCTSVFEKYDARSAVIAGLQSLNYAKNGVDVVSGTKVMSYFAEPEWRSVYDRIAKEHPNTTVGVFHCGSPAETKTLRHLAQEFTDKTTTKFAFHKENF